MNNNPLQSSIAMDSQLLQKVESLDIKQADESDDDEQDSEAVIGEDAAAAKARRNKKKKDKKKAKKGTFLRPTSAKHRQLFA